MVFGNRSICIAVLVASICSSSNGQDTPQPTAPKPSVVPTDPVHRAAYFAEEKKKSIAAYKSHPISKLLKEHVEQPKKEFYASGSLKWVSDRKPDWKHYLTNLDDHTESIGLHYSTDGNLRMDFDFALGTLQSIDNQRARSLVRWIPTESKFIPLDAKGDPVGLELANVSKYEYADILHDGRRFGGSWSRFAFFVGPLHINWLYQKGNEIGMSVKHFESLEGESDRFKIAFDTPHDVTYTFDNRDGKLQLISRFNTGKTFGDPQTELKFKNQLIDDVYLPTEVESWREDELCATMKLEYGKWGAKREFTPELTIPAGTYVNDRVASKVYIAE
jgi:hypothetical protein